MGVRRPGDQMLMYGSTMFLVQVIDEYHSDPALWTTAGVDPQTLALAAGTSTAGTMINWLQSVTGRPSFDELTAEALALISRYDWPGNVRQLENALFRAVVLADGDELTVAEFPQIAAQVDGFDVRVPPLPAPSLAPRAEREVVRVEVRDPNMRRLVDDHGQVRKLDDLEAETIRFALDYYRGQMSEMARRLGIGRSTLYRKMKEYGFDDAAGEPPTTSDAA